MIAPRGDDDEHRQRLARQARLVARLHHPNVVAFVDAGEDDGRPFIAFEYITGESLQAVLRRDPAPALPDRLALIEQLCDGLSHVHAAGIVHGDINPGNLMVADGGVLKILDFGRARFTSDSTAAADMIGAAMAPEHATGSEVDHRADIFAAGAVMYEAVALQQAFPGGISERLTWIRGDRPVRLAEHAPHLAPELARIVDRALERAPENRYQSIDDMRRDIAAVRRLPLIVPYSPPADVDPFSIGSPVPPPVAEPQHDLLEEIIASTRGRDGEPSRGSVAVFSKDVSIPGGTGVVTVDDVQFTVYRPKAVRPRATYAMLVFTHRGDRPPDAPDAPLPIEQVRSRASQLLGPDARLFRDTTTDAKHSVPAYGEITLVPRMDGIDFAPERHTFRWVSEVHEHRFELTARPELDGHVARGSLTAYLGMLLLAEVDLAIRVESSAPTQESAAPTESVTARAYRKIFASYSRKDVAVVEQFERLVAALGDSYLRDVRNLRAGERWEDGLLRLIDEADVFQLFWSWNAMRSPNVRREWEYALSLNRPSFVRPTYWETPLPESSADGLPPARLRQLHFHHLGQPAAREPDTSGGAAADEDTDTVRRAEGNVVPPAAPPSATPFGWRPEAHPSPPLPGPFAPAPTAGPPIGAGPVTMPSAVRRSPMIRRVRFIGAAAVLVLAIATGTMVLRNELPQDRPPMAVPAENRPPPPVPATEDRASIERLLAEYVDALSRRDEVAIGAIDPAFEGFPGAPTPTRTTPSDVVITLAPDGKSAELRARLDIESPPGRSAPAPRPPAELRWSLRKEGDAWRVIR